MIKVIVFDLGGVCFEWNLSQLVNRLSKFTGVPEAQVKEAYLRHIKDFHVSRVNEKQFWARFCKSIEKDFDHRLLKIADAGNSRPIYPVIKIVKILRGKYRTILFTNNTKRFERVDKKYKITKNFDIVINSYKVRMQKPYKNMYWLLIKKANCKPGEILFIDDLERNLKPARKMGIRTILFRNTSQLKRDLRKKGIKLG